MKLTTIYAIKDRLSQVFLDGKRLPVTVLNLPTHAVAQIKTKDKDGYESLQLAIGAHHKKASKPLLGHLKKSKLSKPRYLRESQLVEGDLPELGAEIDLSQILAEGDYLNATATSKGKGFAGVVKRYHFAGGPRTHGQSDRERATGSIGRGTTPGRVLKGKKMPGHMGAVTKTIRNLKVVGLNWETRELQLLGMVPGSKTSLIKLTLQHGQN